MDLIQEVGAIAGLAAFLGLAVLALLYFAQARDVRRLRESASFLVEGEDEGPVVAPAERAAVAVADKEPETAAAAAAATAPDDREAFRRAELARQAAERRKRFEQRRGRPGRGAFGGGGRPAWLSDGPSTAVIVIGALLLVAGIAFGATRLIGGGDEAGGGGGNPPGAKGQKTAPTKVAVLNGTAEGGLAAEFARQLKPSGYEVSPVTNTPEPFVTSVVMFDTGGEESARQIAAQLGIQDVQPIDTGVRSIAEGAAVAVVLGDDLAAGSTDTTDTTAGVSGI